MRNNLNIRLSLAFWLAVITFSFPGAVFGQPGSREILNQIDKPAQNKQLSYSPEDGTTVKLNPPPFVWIPIEPVKGNFIYILQISKDREFKNNVITRRGIDISTYALEQTLEPGEWYWRYGVEGGLGEWYWKFGLEKGNR